MFYSVDEICTTGVLERTRSHRVMKYLNFSEKSSLIPDFVFVLVSPPQNK